MLTQLITQKIKTFRTREEGNVAIEAVIILPMLIWAYLAMFTIFEAYRQYTAHQKATYTISDLISRQATPMDADFLDGTYSLYDDLTRSVGEPGLRVTVVKYDSLLLEYQVVWSRTRGGMVGLSSADIAEWTHRLPVLAPDDQIIIVEASAGFTPVFNIGLANQTINNFVFTRPRYAKQVCFDDVCDLPGSPPPVVSENDQA